jgi:hypothetical protein
LRNCRRRSGRHSSSRPRELRRVCKSRVNDGSPSLSIPVKFRYFSCVCENFIHNSSCCWGKPRVPWDARFASIPLRASRGSGRHRTANSIPAQNRRFYRCYLVCVKTLFIILLLATPFRRQIWGRMNGVGGQNRCSVSFGSRPKNGSSGGPQSQSCRDC